MRKVIILEDSLISFASSSCVTGPRLCRTEHDALSWPTPNVSATLQPENMRANKLSKWSHETNDQSSSPVLNNQILSAYMKIPFIGFDKDFSLSTGKNICCVLVWVFICPILPVSVWLGMLVYLVDPSLSIRYVLFTIATIENFSTSFGWPFSNDSIKNVFPSQNIHWN